MTEQKSMEIQATVRLKFIDYVSLQIWCRWVNLPRLVPIFLLSILAGLSIATAVEGLAFKDLVRGLAESWPMYGAIVFFGLLVVFAIPVFMLIVQWPFGSVPREMQFAFDDAGIHYSASDTKVTLGWPSAHGYSETAAALFIRTKRLFLRVPKRSLSADQLGELRILFETKGMRRVSAWHFR